MITRLVIFYVDKAASTTNLKSLVSLNRESNPGPPRHGANHYHSTTALMVGLHWYVIMLLSHLDDTRQKQTLISSYVAGFIVINTLNYYNKSYYIVACQNHANIMYMLMFVMFVMFVFLQDIKAQTFSTSGYITLVRLLLHCIIGH